jgi:hypothetical protein
MEVWNRREVLMLEPCKAYLDEPGRCALDEPGHNTCIGDFYSALAETTVRIRVTAVVLEDGFIELEYDGRSHLVWNHEPEAVVATLRLPNAFAEWAPGTF